jgi:N6-L-threonylcarbamoyladenine synthase
MNILAIETSFDETSISIVQNGKELLAHTLATSSSLHIKTGGVMPETAARQQILYIIPTLEKTLKSSNLEISQIDAIAVTSGPGLIGSLLVGTETAKTLSYLWNKPIIPVNHLIAHLYANWLDDPPELRALGLVVSGGHTDLVLISSHGNIQLLGSTRDDAAGEAFDKLGRILNLPYPAGPQIAILADKYIQKNPNTKLNLFPRPMSDSDTLDFSFSGLKTAVSNYIKSNPQTPDTIAYIAAQIQEAIIDSLIKKLDLAINIYNPKSLLISGGVASNNRLRQKTSNLADSQNVPLYIPSVEFCTDNSVMVAVAAYYHPQKLTYDKITCIPSLGITDSPL